MPVERIWPEVNSRVNYPIKNILVDLDNRNIINMEDETQKFCVSAVSCLIATFGLNMVVRSWNEHPIAGRFMKTEQ